MSNNLIQIIFEQFLEIVERLSIKSCIDFNQCDFDYIVREKSTHRLIDVIYVVEDVCCRRKDIIATIDTTDVCLDYLTTCKWVEYLEKLANEFISDICPKKIVVVLDQPRKCRPQPPKWEPLPCTHITTVIRKRPCPEPEPECEIIIEKECECKPECIREPCLPKKKVIIRYENDKPWKCGDHDVYVDPNQKSGHGFNTYKGNIDYNDHKWVSSKNKACTSCAQISSTPSHSH